MPIEPVILDTSQRRTEAVAVRGGAEFRIVEGVEAAVGRVRGQSALRETSTATQNEGEHSGLSAEFEAARLEAGARLALAVERVELNRPEHVVRKFQQTTPVVIFGSLQLSVRV